MKEKICPVCGLRYVETQYNPPNPRDGVPPFYAGTLYVHEWKADPERRGHVTVSGCVDYSGPEGALEHDTWHRLTPEDDNL